MSLFTVNMETECPSEILVGKGALQVAEIRGSPPANSESKPAFNALIWLAKF